ncbi:unnamed protein product [Phyllotreta striolata]|uniref:DUF5009 domain-containing protein n=1 Tax=Phyllotreta striolata TaxID=444603 RepID=A0A9N9TVI3_PHYSR|nr:unnamed protein product [Phyllotreta striolata]
MRWCFVDDYDENNIEGFNLADLTLDQFYLNLNIDNKSIAEDVYLYTLNKECYKCPYVRTPYCNGSIRNCDGKNVFKTAQTFRLSTVHKEYFPQEDRDGVICDIKGPFGQFGVYNVDVNKSGCFVDTLKEPVNIYSPIITVFLIYLASFLLILGSICCWKRYKSRPKVAQKTEEVPKKGRIRCLDVYRGLATVVMVFVNYGQGGYDVLEHAHWNGLHLADLVFPSFLWIMGACIPLGLATHFKKGTSNKDIILPAVKRFLKLFIIGVFVGGGADLDYLRIMGILQRLGIASCAVTIIMVFTMDRSPCDNTNGFFKDILKLWKGWMVVIAMLLLHTVIVFGVKPPGCPRGYLGPGGLHENRSYVDCVGGATGYIDGLILGKHRYQNPTTSIIYESKAYDPEGLVGCLSTVFHCFIGAQAGVTLLCYKGHYHRLIRWLSWALIAGIVGGALCGFSKEDGIIPVNKNLWSLSFVMATASFSFFATSIFYVLIDMRKWWSGAPLIFAGMNTILIYAGHEMTDQHFPLRWYLHNYSRATGDPRRTHFLALMSDVWSAQMWTLIGYYLYKIKFFFTV